MGNRDLKIVPVAVSILVSFLSAILILGAPAEMYTKGTQYYLYVFGQMSAVVLATVLFVPLFYPLKLTSMYEVSLGVILYKVYFKGLNLALRLENFDKLICLIY